MDFKQKLLDYFALDENAFKEMSRPIEEVKLLDPNSIESMAKIKERIFRAIENKEKIIIYGDYDCDGVSATTIVVKTFEKEIIKLRENKFTNKIYEKKSGTKTYYVFEIPVGSCKN